NPNGLRESLPGTKTQQLGRKAVPVLLAALQFPEPDRRGHAAYLLGLTGDPTVVSSLAPLLSGRTKMAMAVSWMPTLGSIEPESFAMFFVCQSIRPPSLRNQAATTARFVR